MRTLSLAALLAAMLHVGAGTSVAQPGFHPYGGPHPGGTTLGIYAVESPQGLRIMGTINGYSAHGRLLPNDILLRATAENLPIFSITTHARMEYAKTMIGANRMAAIEFFRPGVGNMYAWMTFELDCNSPHVTLLGVTPGSASSFKAEFIMETERPGAQGLFAVATETTAPAAAEAPAAAAAPAEAAPEAIAPEQPAAPEEAPAQLQLPEDSASSENSLDALFN